MDFISRIAANPLAGDVIPGAQGARKVRWHAKGQANISPQEIARSLRND